MKGLISRGRRCLQQYGAVYALRRLADMIFHISAGRYDKRWQSPMPKETELARQRSTPVEAGLISVVVPVYNTDPLMLQELADSLLAQTYPCWEAVLYNDCSTKQETLDKLADIAGQDTRFRVFHGQKNQGISTSSNSAVEKAGGEWIALLDHDDLLTPDALYRMAEVIVDKQPDLIYSDEDKIAEDSSYYLEPHFKPDFCPDNLRSGNYICHLMVLRKELLIRAGGFRTAFNGSQDHDLTLRCVEMTDKIQHIPQVLYHWRAVQSSVSHANLAQCVRSAAAAVEEHMARIGWPGRVEICEGMLRLRYEIKEDPFISVIIIKNGKDDATVCRRLLEADAREKVEWLEADGSANRYAAMNQAAQKAKGDVLLFVDASVQVQTPDFMTELLMYAQRDDVGAVTPLMWDRHNLITHGGFAIGMDGIAICREKALPRQAGGWHLLMHQSHNVAAVSGACLMIRKDHWIPFDEAYTSGLAAVDWSARLLKMGKRQVFTPYAGALCQHRELLLLGKDRNAADVERFRNTHGKQLQDPCYSARFSRKVANGTIE